MKLQGAAMRAVRVLPGRARQALSEFFRLQATGGISVPGVLCASTLSAVLACPWLSWALPKPAEA